MTPVRERVPVYCACLNEKAIRMIGEVADGWMPTFWPYNRLDEGRKWITEGAEAAGRNADDIVTAPFTTVIPMPDKEQSYESARGLISFYIGGMGDYYKAMLTRMGFGENAAVVDRLYKDKQRKEAAEAVSQEMLDALVIAGEPDFCTQRLGEWRTAGVGLPILTLPTDMGPEICEMYMQIMAPTS
jgi:alkanesulfonate monooxygenase SsuD/methylene tetrahydromethanopterin reductase-like flavin-dependent oxidoreductase (luciferase family)